MRKDRGVTKGERGQIPRSPNHYGGATKSQQYHKYFLQYSTFAFKRPQVRDPTRGVGGQCPGRNFWSKEGIANGLSRMNLKLDLGLTFWLRLDLPYVWLGLSRFKRLSRCPLPVSKMSRNFTSVKFSNNWLQPDDALFWNNSVVRKMFTNSDFSHARKSFGTPG